MNTGSILHVEDDDAVVLLVQVALQEAGVAVHYDHVSDVDSAFRYLALRNDTEGAANPSLILLDLNLPRKSGFELLAALREMKALHGIPIVVFTSSATPADRTKSLALGASAYIRKPSEFEEYVRTVRELVGMIPSQPLL